MTESNTSRLFNKIIAYEKIKKILLQDSNIENVDLEPKNNRIFITPRQDKDFYSENEPLENFIVGDSNKLWINDIYFYISGCQRRNSLILCLIITELDDEISNTLNLTSNVKVSKNMDFFYRDEIEESEEKSNE